MDYSDGAEGSEDGLEASKSYIAQVTGGRITRIPTKGVLM